ncbi:uncharacterized protein [Aegilops tauschii subsp. strangulata]|uniref:Uncharacterized protein n=2 Tax=Triticinae TaxID=1648030 RepID=A0A453CEC7_AEGTS|nr:uncharacterized protein LOC109786416 [Aegilops tauschii subsp. strangulata]XP_044333385.1 uncharacterized protein LOC123053863 isoform X4 [Triticum aestivum]XP_045089101.1 uncharacterized protein LOC109786416 [Aegilops tauschii subsp. strangulata]
MEDLKAFVKDSGFVEADDQTHHDLTSGYNIDEVDSSGGLDSHPLQVKLERRHARDYQRRDDAGSESDIICVSAGRSKGGKKRTVSHTSNRRIISKKHTVMKKIRIPTKVLFDAMMQQLGLPNAVYSTQKARAIGLDATIHFYPSKHQLDNKSSKIININPCIQQTRRC